MNRTVPLVGSAFCEYRGAGGNSSTQGIHSLWSLVCTLQRTVQPSVVCNLQPYRMHVARWMHAL